MRYLLFLLCFGVYAQTTQINSLRLDSLQEVPGNAGALRVEWYADPGNTDTHGANEAFFIRYSTEPTFIDAPIVRVGAWDGATELNLDHTLTGLGNGTWYVSVAFGWGETIYDVVAGGGVDGGWTQFGIVVMDDSYIMPELIMPLFQPYESQEFILQWIDSPNIPTYELQHSEWQDFRVFETASLLRTDNGVKRLNLEGYGKGLIFFRLRGTTDNGVTTEWSYSTLYYDPARLYTYLLPWVADNDTVTTQAGLAILNEALQTTVRIGWTPPPVGGFISETIWKKQDVYQGSVLMVELAALFNADLQGQQIIFEASEPIVVTIFYDALEFGDVPTHNAFTLPEGSSNKWLVPLIRMDARHRYSVVISNHDSERYSNVSWMFRFPGYGQEYFGMGFSIPPGGNKVIDLASFPDIPIEVIGYLTIEVGTPTDTGVIYMIRSEPITGVAVNSGSSAQQK